MHKTSREKILAWKSALGLKRNQLFKINGKPHFCGCMPFSVCPDVKNIYAWELFLR
jgi:hypothetical protein